MPTTPTGETAFHASRHLGAWLAEHDVSLCFTTYQAGKLFFVGRDQHDGVTLFNRTLARVMGLATRGGTLWVASQWQLWRFENALQPGESAGDHDAWFVPQLAYTTGDVDTHDVALDGCGEPVFVATLLSCIAAPDPRCSLRPLWRPPFISRIAAEDRCHLNGLAMRDGTPAYVTCVGRSDAREGWRVHRRDGGLLLNVTDGEAVATGLSMPHSPRWYRDRVWLLNAGSGEFGYVDPASGRFVALAFCPGFLRGLSFVGDFAVVGISALRERRTMEGLALESALAARGVAARCAVLVVDLRSGDVVHELSLQGAVSELFDTAVLHGFRRPGAVGFRNDEIHRTLVLPPTVATG